ncbi:MAG: hypothetical protein AAGA20_16940 [Planctomycetota bacterium]
MLKSGWTLGSLLLCGSASAMTSLGTTAVARWDGHVVERGEAIVGLSQPAQKAIETWRTFAKNRGYRVDLDETQSVLVVSDAERFRHFSASATVVERVLHELERFGAPDEVPIVVLRASNEDHLNTAVRAAEALGFAAHLVAYVEDAPRTERRAVDARLAEAIVHLQLELEEPHLSAWMADGLASCIAEETTGRALVDGETRTLRSVQSEVARAESDLGENYVSLYEISGVRLEAPAEPLESHAMAVMAFLWRYHGPALPRIVTELGRRTPMAGRSKYREEERSLERHLGPMALDELSEALREGHTYRP